MNDQIRLNPAYDPAPVGVQVRSLYADLRENPRLLRHFAITGIMTIALFAFEIFNFDTTRFALSSLIGTVRFMGFTWAAILAVAFCAIDFAGLFRLFSPDTPDSDEHYTGMLMGAWLLGATMNAIMTWWAVSLTLLENPYGNAVLSADMLLKIVPIFVATLVWLTRVLFIGALNYSGEQFIAMRRSADGTQKVVEVPTTIVQEPKLRQAVRIKEKPVSNRKRKPAPKLQAERPAPRVATPKPRAPKPAPVVDELFADDFNQDIDEQPTIVQPTRKRSQVRPRSGGGIRRPNSGRQASSRN